MFQPPASEEERQRVHRVLADRLASEEDVRLAYLHGSFLESMYRDIDVAVLLGTGPDGGALDRGDLDGGDPVARGLRLSELLTRELDAGVEVDVRPLNDAPLPFRFEVLRKGRLLVSKDEELRVAHETRTIRAFHDFQHHLTAYGREILGARA